MWTMTETPLNAACGEGHDDATVRLLLQRGARSIEKASPCNDRWGPWNNGSARRSGAPGWYLRMADHGGEDAPAHGLRGCRGAPAASFLNAVADWRAFYPQPLAHLARGKRPGKQAWSLKQA